MKSLKVRYLPVLICIIGILFFQNCKKGQNEMDAPTPTPQTEEEESLTETPSVAASPDFTTITWSTAKSQPTLTHEVHGEVVKGKLYIFGGYDINKRPNAWTPTKRSYVYDPISNTWTAIANLPQTPSGSNFGGVTHFGLTTDGTDIYFAGGYTSNANGTGQLFGTKQAWKYVVASNTYVRLPDLPQELAAGQLRYVNGKIHYMGGANLARADVGLHYALDLNNLGAGWKSLAPVLNPVNHPGSAVLGGKIYFLGGAHHQDEETETQTTLEVYNETSNSWAQLAKMPTGVDHVSSSVVTYDNRIIVLGGETSHNVLSKQVMAYTPTTNSWAELTPLPVGKSAGVGAVLNGNIYYTGGNFSNVNHKGIPSGGSTNPGSGTTLQPTADAFVRNGTFATANYGSDATLVVKGSNSVNYARKSYLKFALGSSITSVTSARLRVYGLNIDNATAVKLSCYAVDSDNWTEAGINFNNSPATGSNLSSATINNQAKYVEFDVTAFVKTQLAGDKTVTLSIKDPTNQNSTVQFNSRENSTNKPQLVIQ
ncbi:MAG: DNRLRE domain-containing protein [Mucilaginibacter sp.]|uniref:CBM96 family carbohydrate-binding protein n=1 Tax=Mucilaginibacter sp. TaxID=1882438 RepID=UPI00319F3A99